MQCCRTKPELKEVREHVRKYRHAHMGAHFYSHERNLTLHRNILNGSRQVATLLVYFEHMTKGRRLGFHFLGLRTEEKEKKLTVAARKKNTTKKQYCVVVLLSPLPYKQ